MLNKLRQLALSSMLVVLGGQALAHEMVPTYPTWEPAYMQGLVKTTVELFNKRKDVEYYEIGVFTKDWEPIPFVSSFRIIQLKYLGHASIDIYLRDADRARATYVCSRSKLRKDSQVRTVVSSRICSKFK